MDPEIRGLDRRRTLENYLPDYAVLQTENGTAGTNTDIKVAAYWSDGITLDTYYRSN